ncbi:cAMP-activated global transcriptional regulator CRP [bacterium HR08]|nr:cAMP-activated global transcriptional regulator CRP [bacterium HR08]
MARESFWCLRQVCILDGLSEHELQELSRIAPMRHFKAGQFIYHIGQRADMLYIIGEGEVTISTVTPEGKELILGLFKNGDVFGELFAPEVACGKTEAKAHTDVWLCALTERDFVSICKRQPEVAINFIRVLMRRVHELQEEVEDLAFATARERFVKLLHRLCAESQQEAAKAPECVVRYSQEELARMLGLTRERVNAVIAELKERGVLRSHYGYLTVDRSRLRSLLPSEEAANSAFRTGYPIRAAGR